MYQSGHVNSSGETCHNASTMRKGVSHPRGKKAKTGQARYLVLITCCIKYGLAAAWQKAKPGQACDLSPTPLLRDLLKRVVLMSRAERATLGRQLPAITPHWYRRAIKLGFCGTASCSPSCSEGTCGG